MNRVDWKHITIATAFSVALAVMIGVSFAHWGASGLEAAVGSAAGAIAGHMIGNSVDRLSEHGGSALARLLTASRSHHGLPPNHDLARAIREAHVEALRVMAEETLLYEREINEVSDRSSWERLYRVEGFLRRVRRWARRDAGRTPGCYNASVVGLLARNPTGLVHLEGASNGYDEPGFWAVARAAVVQELEDDGIGWIPEAFLAALSGSHSTRVPTWREALQCFVMEQVKHNDAVHRVLEFQIALQALDTKHSSQSLPSDSMQRAFGAWEADNWSLLGKPSRRLHRREQGAPSDP